MKYLIERLATKMFYRPKLVRTITKKKYFLMYEKVFLTGRIYIPKESQKENLSIFVRFMKKIKC